MDDLPLPQRVQEKLDLIIEEVEEWEIQLEEKRGVGSWEIEDVRRLVGSLLSDFEYNLSKLRKSENVVSPKEFITYKERLKQWRKNLRS